MSERVPCKICGAGILPATAERTGGFCMPCAKDPLGRSARVPPPSPPPADVLLALRSDLAQAVLGAARKAVSELSVEKIYGFALYHGQFLYAGVTVFTESGLDAKVKDYASRGYASTREQLRWSPCDSPHHMFSEGMFGKVEQLFVHLDRVDNADFSKEVERIFMECLHAVGSSGILDPTCLILLMEGDQSDESRFAYAERFNSTELLARFRNELADLDPGKLDF